ncbi:pyridoxamine 5'-phosphate oxidase family protein [Streptomyces sp. NPDC001068]|uniref:pyridoxamine 5'-phosphate oxidase family protein n=1 Tax=Streptomyces sp. NPDC001068 TaxID=3364544 RepID=UPI0036ACA305
MLAPARLRSGVVQFLAERTFAAITGRDVDGRLWITPLVGPPGFLRAVSPDVLHVQALPTEGTPLRRLPEHQPVGMIVIEFATRRRLRINGTLTHTDESGLYIDVEQVYGNCPQYIQSRHLHSAPDPAVSAGPARRGSALTHDDIALVRRSDTFLVGTTHPTRGNDASHRGGSPGFVRAENGRLWWPDYSGNNMFNTLGNLRTDPTASLLFLDFTTGRSLHLSGHAELEWTRPGVTGDDDGTGRRVHFYPEHLVADLELPLRADSVAATPGNPPLTD